MLKTHNTKAFRQDFKRLFKSGKDMEKLRIVMELLEEEISKFIEIHGTDRDNLQECIHAIRLFMKEYIANAEFREIIDSGNFTDLATNPVFTMKELSELDGWRDDLINYVKDYINLNIFMGVA